MLREIISDEQRLVEHFQNTPIRVLDGRTMAQALAAGDGEKVLRYLQTISGGQNG
ncbi:MAG: hypothetical protein Q4F49_08615 [Pseudoxanthomonas suwonensis]|nr:hypothetical protein [Pseudoxanthomonas suwonensis]